MGEKITKFQYILLFVLLVIGSFKTYNSYHKNYPLPYHHDEWQHIGISVMINEQGYNKQFNPYLGESREHKNLESGFHLFLASISELYEIELINLYQYLATFFFLISGLTIFITISKLTKNNLTGIVSLIIFIFLKTNINILGKDFFIPLVMTIPFIFTYILYFSEFLKENKTTYLYLLGSILLFLLFIYPPSFIMMLLPSMFFYILNFKSFKNKKLLSLLIPVILILVYFFWRDNIIGTIRYIFETLYFEPGWGKLEIRYSIPFFYGVFNTFLGLYGFYLSYKKKQLRFFLAFAFLNLALTAVFNLFNFSILIPYSRALHYSFLALCPLTAYGFVYLVKKYLKKQYLKYVLIVIFFIFLMFSKYPLDESYKNYKEPVITKEAYSALIWFKDAYGTNNNLVTPYFMTSAIYPISKNKVMSLIPSQLEGGLIQENLNFYNYDCLQKKNVIDQAKADYILSYNKIECDFLSEVYSDNFYIYSLE